jgi:hypothetical protein
MIMISVLEKQYMETVIRMGRRMQSGEIDWEQRRYEIAKDMMAAIMNNPDITAGVACEPKPQEDVPATLARVSLTFADALVADLKKTQEKK